MVYKPHYRLRIGGEIPGASSWSVAVNWANHDYSDPANGTANGVQSDLEDWADAVRQLNSTQVLPQDVQSLVAPATVSMIRASHIGTDGREDAVALLTGNFFNTGATPKMPAQVALAVSLLSGRPGASNRGRLYWPAGQATLNAQGRVPTATAAAVATATAGFLRDLSNAAQNGPVVNAIVPVVASATRGTLIGITSVRVGDRLDSQRRRAEAQSESYSIAAVPS